MANVETVLAWHWINKNRRTFRGDLPVVVGETLTHDGAPDMCNSGLHASEQIIDALHYATGSIVCRVEVGGTTIKGNDKLVGTTRKCLWMIDAERLLHEFGCRCAERALKQHNVTDNRSWDAIKVKRLWLQTKATDKELAAARSAARTAARTAEKSWQNEELERMVREAAGRLQDV